MLLEELCKYIGRTVIIFTSSGGDSGLGFIGVLLRVNDSFITLVNRIGAPPNWPLDQTLSCNHSDSENSIVSPVYIVSSLCDIPVSKITAFCHHTL